MHNVCLVDLDDTLADFRTPMIEVVNRITGRDTEWTGYDVPPESGLSHDDFIEIMIQEDIIGQIGIHDSSHKFLNDLHHLGYYTVLITARGWHPEGREQTQQWVDKHELDIDELIVVGAHESKTDVIGKFGDDIVFSIDDRMKHCREYSQTNSIDHVLLYNAIWNDNMGRWNKDWDGYDYDERIFDLSEIIDHVEWATENRRVDDVRQISG